MGTLAIYTLPTGRSLEIELEYPTPREAIATDQEFTPASPFSTATKVIHSALNLQESFEPVAEFCDALIGGIAEKSRMAEEVAVSFSVKFSATGNVIIAGGSVEGTVNVTVKYKPPTSTEIK